MNWKSIFCGIACFGLFFVFSASSRTVVTEDQACFVVLDSPPVLVRQHRLSGNAPLKSTAFKAKQADARQYARIVEERQNTLSSRIYSIDSNAQVLHRFNQLVNALAVQIDSSKWDELRQIPGVAYVAPIRTVKPVLTRSSSLMNLPQAWERFRQGDEAGKDIFVAVIDTGIDVTHPAFSPEGYAYPAGFPKGNANFTNEKVIAARVFPPLQGNKGDTTLFDRMGHGTNVATIIAANRNVESPLGTLSGVAPKAYLGNYKVFTSSTSENSQVIRAIESAVGDGADVLNLSLGSEIFGDPQHDLQVQAINNAVDLGVVVIVAAGNGGSDDFTIGSPSQAEGAITVGSISNSHVSNGNPPNFDVYVSILENGETILKNIPGVVGAKGGPFVSPIIGTFPIQDIDLLDGGGYGSPSDGLACESLSLDSPLTGWAMVNRGDCTFVSKINRVQNLGAKGVLFINNKYEYPLTWPETSGTTIPSILIDQESGKMVKDVLQSGGSLSIRVQGIPISDSRLEPNRLSSFSPAGPTINYVFKPDVLAIGEGSFAGTQNDDTNDSSFNASGFMWLAGTSMAAPRVSGLAAILRQQHPDWPPAWIKSALALSASRPINMKNGKPASLLQTGSGAVNAGAALEVDTIVTPAVVNFGMHMVPEIPPDPQWIHIVNVSGQPAAYTLQPSDGLNFDGVIVSEESFVLEPGQKKEIQITLPSLTRLPLGDLEGDLICTNLTTGRSYSIPYWARIKSATTPIGGVLLVDDDGGNAYDEYYTARLIEIGLSFTNWDVKSMGYPVLDYLKRFKNVIWFLGDNTLNSIPDENSTEYRRMFNPRTIFETEMMKYLAGGGTLFLSGQDYSDDKQNSAFLQEVLMVSVRDQENGANTIQGVSSHAFADGLGPFIMSFPSGFENWTDFLTPLDNTKVQRAFIADGSRARTVGVTVDVCTYRAVFLAFPLETLDAAAGATILRDGLRWLNQKEPSLAPALVQLNPNTIDLASQSGPFAVTLEGNGFVLSSGYRAYLDSIPVSDLERESCNALVGTLPAALEPGVYSLSLRTGDGHGLYLPNALTVLDSTGTRVSEWDLY